ncbi:H-NS histone family protein [Gemmobacter lutimaris]|uniref:H-NS histone family protein n=1 Tax=Gemmobacter lutimaris TaxID=2306023 RepID=A0A398BSI8_9RHOB|nr:H-NS histone family protein [Gemmobacter lutimaris]RID91861.1 H-NS histone family protein [Gemmobacter lutimaris]
MIDLSAMTLSELRVLERHVAKAIGDYENRKKREALAEMKALAAQHGFTFNDLGLEDAAPNTRAPAKPKYANPADPTQTWSGRGRKPGWAIDALAQGKTLDDLAI